MNKKGKSKLHHFGMNIQVVNFKEKGKMIIIRVRI